LTLHDEIWGQVPERRPLDSAALELALETAREAGQRGPAGGSPKVLDLGVGDGRVALELARAGADVTGVDRSQVALELARRSHPELELVATLDDGRLPFEDSAFDAVVCLDVLQHVADTQALLSESRRVLRPGGELAVSVPWHGRMRSALIALFSFERHHDPLEPVLRFYTARSLGELLERFGFEQPQLRAAGGPPLARQTLLARARRG
jgi:ubiquinone/menaquinone biosynthesis C-methylase UbiE